VGGGGGKDIWLPMRRWEEANNTGWGGGYVPTGGWRSVFVWAKSITIGRGVLCPAVTQNKTSILLHKYGECGAQVLVWTM
jgi:hypothetical protein